MRAILAVAVVGLLAGCGTIDSRTLEYCDNEQKTIIGLPVYTTRECISVSNSDSGSGIQIPDGVPE